MDPYGNLPQIGERVRDGLGHWWRILSIVSPYRYLCESETCPGNLARLSRSEIRRAGE